MDYNKWIADLEPGDEIEGFYILKTAQIKTSNSGKPFLAAGIADRSGTVDAKFWDYAGPLGPQDEGTVIKLRGGVSEYRGSLQLILTRVRPVQEDDRYSLGDLVPTAPIDLAGASGAGGRYGGVPDGVPPGAGAPGGPLPLPPRRKKHAPQLPQRPADAHPLYGPDGGLSGGDVPGDRGP